MNIKEQINSHILTFLRNVKAGGVFRVDQFRASHDYNRSEISRIFATLADEGTIVKLTKGIYLKPSAEQKRRIDNLRPEELIGDFLFDKDGANIGYITGNAYLASLGLLDKAGDVVTVATPHRHSMTVRRGVTFTFMVQRLPINIYTFELLQMLDALRNINRTKEMVEPAALYERIKDNVRAMSPSRIDRMVDLAMRYNHMTKALAGSMIESIHGTAYAGRLLMSLNCTTSSEVHIPPEKLPNAQVWRLVCR
ncbi:MAG: hypothetical protein K2N21_08335 [Rikenellaceae bacterium]|nr:hypothetical protein [Rikenellaceae bacterium]